MGRVQLLAGCRPNEVMRMTPRQIDRSGDVWRYQPIKHNNAWRAKTRTIYLGKPATDNLLFLDNLMTPGSYCEVGIGVERWRPAFRSSPLHCIPLQYCKKML